MKTIKQVECTPELVEFIPEKSDMKPNVIYISEQYKASCHLCLCGCGELIALNIDPVTGWIITTYGDPLKVTVSPSIGNYQLPCKSHYIITKNKANFV